MVEWGMDLCVTVMWCWNGEWIYVLLSCGVGMGNGFMCSNGSTAHCVCTSHTVQVTVYSAYLVCFVWLFVAVYVLSMFALSYLF